MPDRQGGGPLTRPARHILHPTDFSAASDLALAHALRVALLTKAELVILHVGALKDTEEFPSVRKILEAWGLLEPGAPRSAVVELGVGIKKIEAYGPTIAGAIANYIENEPVDLLVMATEGRRGLAAWFTPSTAEEAARRTLTPTLFVPDGCRGCVSLQDGKVSMKQIVIPVDHDPPCDEAVERGLRALHGFGDQISRLTLLYVGEESRFPYVRLEEPDCEVQRVCRTGTPADEILAETRESDADLLIMTTAGRHGFYDALRGTTTEQVLHHTTCPLLAVPANVY